MKNFCRNRVVNWILRHQKHLCSKDGYRHNEAQFGTPMYSGSLEMVSLVYANSLLCDEIVNQSVSFPTGPWNGMGTFVLLVDRGGCNFVTKVRNAQHHGAAGVIIADDVCVCGTDDCDIETEQCEDHVPTMADDGTGADVTVPSMIIHKQDSDRLIDYLKECGQDQSKSSSCGVKVEMKWSLPRPDDRVEWDLWTSPINENVEAFKQGFKSIQLALGDHLFMVPHYRLYVCGDSEGCGSLCTNGGRYCQMDPDGSDHPLVGADVVLETLRRKCIWNEYAETAYEGVPGGVGEAWWNYVNNFTTICDTPESFADESCVQKVMKHCGIDEAVINECISESGGVTADAKNSILEGELQLGSENNIYAIPTVLVNNVKLYGSITPNTVLGAICAGYSDNTSPEACACAKEPSPDKMNACIDEFANPEVKKRPNHIEVKTTTGVPWWGVLLIVLFVMAIAATLSYLYWRRTQNQMREQVRGILAEYMPLEDVEGIAPADIQPRSFSMPMTVRSVNDEHNDLDGV